jgi:thioredoxin 1
MRRYGSLRARDCGQRRSGDRRGGGRARTPALLLMPVALLLSAPPKPAAMRATPWAAAANGSTQAGTPEAASPSGGEASNGNIAPAKLAAIHELIALNYSPESLRHAFTQMFESFAPVLQKQLQQKGLSPARQQAFIRAFQAEAVQRAVQDFPREQLIAVYDRTFTLADLRQIVAFEKSPAGRKLALSSAAISRQVDDLSVGVARQVAGQVARDVGASFVELNKGDEPANSAVLPAPRSVRGNLYPQPAEAPGDIAAALRRAAAEGKRVLLIFGGNWCYDCHVLEDALENPELEPLVNENYVVVNVNVGDFDQNLDLVAKYGVNIQKGVPALAVLANDGRLLYAQKNGEFEKAHALTLADARQFLKEWAPPRRR